MALKIARVSIPTVQGARTAWGLHRPSPAGARLRLLEGDWQTTGSFLVDGGPEAAAAAAHDRGETGQDVDFEQVGLLSPVTRGGDVLCLGLNYSCHLEELGLQGQEPASAVIFHKASSSLCGARDDVIRPRGVVALDYEIELGLVIGRPITGPVDVGEDNLHEFIGALVITNDISAREVQIAAEQFCKGKSFRTFGPTGPFLVLLEPEELRRWPELVLRLEVNGETRQQAPAAQMIHSPAAILQELSRVRDFAPGDLIATGTPAGVALQAPSRLKAKLAMLLSARRRAEIVARMASRDPAYLRPGDEITASIATADGELDLGLQRNVVVEG